MADEQSTQVVSHGRGGQGNIAADSTKCVLKDFTAPERRGGIGNIGSPNIPPSRGRPHDVDVIPPSAVRQSSGTDYHVGRGGQGNVCSEPSKPYCIYWRKIRGYYRAKKDNGGLCRVQNIAGTQRNVT
ncbi:conserved hypothetical protein [Microsporum canis CBS 113480]|uniref:Uncharacterized protein n=1 Tax=Arthroderma otae (strain ATCC MYA-4605 / CBS 113480) TaxID=554155 RepID=C5FQK9_ARTOC|nr:conserved hypothetical protein [Microsporum canis CBS 113480]EEQ32162.1 conserved hypothetical protein [Microsporum canis CBS 113480]